MTDGHVLHETEAEREARIRYERALIEKGEAEIAAGLGIEDDVLEAWLEELERNPDAPVPSRARTTGAR